MMRNGRWVEAGVLALGLGCLTPAQAQVSHLPRPDFLYRETAVMCAGLNLAFAEVAEPADAADYRRRADAFRLWAGEFGGRDDLAGEIDTSRASFIATVKPSDRLTPWSQMMTQHGGGYGQCTGYWMAGGLKAAEQSMTQH